MITQKPDDRLIRNFRIVAVLIGICLAFVVFTTATIVYTMPSYKRADVPLVVWLNEFILVVGIVAYVQFVTSRFKKSKMLRLFLIFSAFANLVSICFYSFVLIYPLYSNLTGREITIEHMVLAATLGTADFISLVLLQNARVPKLSIQREKQDVKSLFQPVNKMQRLIHIFLDIAVILFMVNTHFIFVNEFFRTDILLVIATIAMVVAYYFVIESVFKTTFGKIMTNSIVVDERGKKASFSRVLIRALCRFIPFDAVSFLFTNMGWHDKLSRTYIVNDRYAWDDDNDILNTYFTGEPEEETITTLIP